MLECNFTEKENFGIVVTEREPFEANDEEIFQWYDDFQCHRLEKVFLFVGLPEWQKT